MKTEKYLDDLIRQQAFIAMEQANAIIYVTDVKEGVSIVDKRFSSWIRKKYKGIIEDRIVLVVNKVDNDERHDDVQQFIRLGLGEPVACSAVHSSGLSEIFYKSIDKMSRYKDTTIAMAKDQAQYYKDNNINLNNILL